MTDYNKLIISRATLSQMTFSEAVESFLNSGIKTAGNIALDTIGEDAIAVHLMRTHLSVYSNKAQLLVRFPGDPPITVIWKWLKEQMEAGKYTRKVRVYLSTKEDYTQNLSDITSVFAAGF